jgi:hypothetical protein
MEPKIKTYNNFRCNTKYEVIEIPLDVLMQINSTNDLETMFNKMDEYIGSDEFKKKFLGENKKQYTYVPRIDPADLPDDAQ